MMSGCGLGCGQNNALLFFLGTTLVKYFYWHFIQISIKARLLEI